MAPSRVLKLPTGDKKRQVRDFEVNVYSVAVVVHGLESSIVM